MQSNITAAPMGGYDVTVPKLAVERAFVENVRMLAEADDGLSIRKISSYPPTYTVLGMDHAAVEVVLAEAEEAVGV